MAILSLREFTKMSAFWVFLPNLEVLILKLGMLQALVR